ncbi:MAG TPA: GNAT family N-acetyltransferase [Myxococcaceae bacterium]|nr:GNAT family N-acetyltransferase [Myxococcaceae bacterium]
MSAPLSSQLRVHPAISEIPRDTWNALVPADSVPFLEWEWLDALESSGSAAAERGWRPSHVALWEGTRLVAAAPAYIRSDSHGEFVFDWTWATAAERVGIRYYPKLVLAVPFAPVTGARFLVAPGEGRAARVRQLVHGLVELARGQGLSSVHILFPREAEAEELGQLGFAIRHGVQYHWLNRGYRSFEEFLERFRSKRRTQLRRERRAPGEQRIVLRTVRGAELAQVDPGSVFDIYAATVGKYLFGLRYLTPAFFERVFSTLAHRLELVEARRDGRLVGGAFNVASPETLYGRYWGCFEEHPFLHFNVCLYHPIEEAIARGLSRFEPGAGGEHKLVRGFEPSLTYSAHWIFDMRLDRAIRQFLEHERNAIRDGLPRWYQDTGFRRTAPLPTPGGRREGGHGA